MSSLTMHLVVYTAILHKYLDFYGLQLRNVLVVYTSLALA